MPELPEVEVTRRRLDGWTAGRTIVRAKTTQSYVLQQSPQKTSRFLRGRAVLGTERRGKHILVRLSDEGGLYLHLGMSGYILQNQRSRFRRLLLHLDDATQVSFDDARMLGRVAVGSYDVLHRKYLKPLGLDPLRDRFTPGALRDILRRSRRPIKVALMEQGLIAGIGNIQAAEVLWLARIDPELPAAEVDPRNGVRRLHRAIQRSFARTIRDLEAGAEYLSDGGVNRFYVYGREGEACPRCESSEIAAIGQAGRTTFFCPACQVGS